MSLLAGLSDCLIDPEDVDDKMVASGDDDLQVEESELTVKPKSKLQVAYESRYVSDVLANTVFR